MFLNLKDGLIHQSMLGDSFGAFNFLEPLEMLLKNSELIFFLFVNIQKINKIKIILIILDEAVMLLIILKSH